MHILHVIRSLHPEYGGPAQLVRCIVAAGPRLGWEGEVACLDDASEDFLHEITFPVHALGRGERNLWLLQRVGSMAAREH